MHVTAHKKQLYLLITSQ